MTAEANHSLTPWGQNNVDSAYLDQWHPENIDAQLGRERTAREVDFVERSLKLESGDSCRILDAACGHARHVNELAARGYYIVGVDYSETFLRRGLRDGEKMGVTPRLVKGDALHLPFGAKFDVVLSLFTSFGFFEYPAENQAMLEQFNQVLTPGGQLLIDVADLDAKLKRYERRGIKGTDGKVRIQESQTLSGIERHAIHTYDPLAQIEHTHREWVENGIMRTYDSRFTYYTRIQLEAMLSLANFTIKERAGDYNWNSPNVETDRIILLTRKASSQ